LVFEKPEAEPNAKKHIVIAQYLKKWDKLTQLGNFGCIFLLRGLSLPSYG